jgi:dUTPase
LRPARHRATDAPLGLPRNCYSMATKSIATTGGVIDARYRGETLILMTDLTPLGLLCESAALENLQRVAAYPPAN